MNFRNIPHFADGLLVTGSGSGRGKAPHTSLLDAENVRIHTGSAVPRPGHSYLDGDDIAPQDISIVYEYTREYHSLGQAQLYREYLYSAGTAIFSWREGQDYYFWVNEGYALDDVDFWMAEYMDYAYIGDGVNIPYKYDGIDYFRVGIITPIKPVVQLGVTGTIITGFRHYKIRYVRRTYDGASEVIDYIGSPFSPIHTDTPAEELDFANLDILVTLTASADPQVTHIEVFGTKIAAIATDIVEEYFLLSQEPNVNALWSDTVANAAIDLLPLTYPSEDTTEDWTNPPAGLSLFVYFKDRVYGVNVKDDPSALRYSDIGEPESWPTDNWLDIRKDDGDIITCLAIRGNSLYIFKRRSIYVITGDPVANPMMEVVVGGEVTGSQTEFGLGCTAARSLASYSDDALIFYNSVHGVWMITSSTITPLSKNISAIKGLDNACAGVVYVSDDLEPYYVLSPPTGASYVCHIPTGRWVKDTGINVPCFLIDSQGRAIARESRKFNHYYNPDATQDNGVDFWCKIRPSWLNLRDGVMHAVVRGLQIQERFLGRTYIDLYNQTEVIQGQYDETDFTEAIGIDGIAGRLFSAELRWVVGAIESLTYLFLRRLGHG